MLDHDVISVARDLVKPGSEYQPKLDLEVLGFPFAVRPVNHLQKLGCWLILQLQGHQANGVCYHVGFAARLPLYKQKFGFLEVLNRDSLLDHKHHIRVLGELGPDACVVFVKEKGQDLDVMLKFHM